MSQTFITGGFGFLGQYIVQAIHTHDPQGELRVLIRTQRKTFLDIEKLDRIHWVRGELTQPESFAEQLKGVDTVIHNAAMVSFKKADAQKVFNSNVIGTRNLARAARDAGCRNFIFISSISSIGFRPPQIMDETMVPDLESKLRNDIYGYTKLLSEIELKEMSRNMRIITLNPSVILGPGSERVKSIVKAIRKMPVIPTMDYVNAFVDVRDVARAVTLALTKGRTGERYIVSSHNVGMVDFTRMVVNRIRPNARVVTLSPFSLRLADKFVTLLDALRLNPGVRRPSLMNIDKLYSHEKIRREMNWEPTLSLEQSIADSVAAGNA
jgi:dihydroflavonol-4-reductase